MLYKKNLPEWERSIRIVAGAMMIAAGFLVIPRSPFTYMLAVMGAMVVLTGFVGYCPVCSISGRRLPKKQQHDRRANGTAL